MYGLTCSLRERPTAQQWDLVSGLLYQFHSLGIEEGEEPPPEGEAALHVGDEFEQAIEPGVLAPPLKFTSYFDNFRDAERAQRAVEGILASLEAVYQINEVEQKDYTEVWKQTVQPIHIDPCWVVRAPWHDPVTDKNTIELVVEPGMAFGTGSHETTRSCLELLAKVCTSKKLGPKSSVLDFGCGSGILAIAVKKLNVGKAIGIDIDPLAIEATRQNSKQNGVTVEVTMDASPFADFDGIVANILKNTLLDFAPSFAKWLKPGGFLILSGLLGEQEPAILERYTSLGFTVDSRILTNNWVSFLLTKN